jgi:RNA polymerase sigma-70 factor (ECF subfamily)
VSQQQPNTDFVYLLTSHQRSLYRFIIMFVPQPSDADEVLQDTNMLLCSKSETFEPGTSFAAWSRQVAKLKVLEFFKRNDRRQTLLDPQVLETVAVEWRDEESSGMQRRDALKACLEKLRAGDRKLIDARYTADQPVESIASQLGRPVSSVYRSLERVRMSLLECIARTLRAEERGK